MFGTPTLTRDDFLKSRSEFKVNEASEREYIKDIVKGALKSLEQDTPTFDNIQKIIDLKSMIAVPILSLSEKNFTLETIRRIRTNHEQLGKEVTSHLNELFAIVEAIDFEDSYKFYEI